MIPFLLVASLLAQEGVPKAGLRRQRYPEFAAIEEAADSVPPGYGAYALLGIADSPKLSDREWRRELIEKAFDRAAAAEPALPHEVMPGVMRGRVLRRAQGERLGLDRLSLQAAAVRAMARLDRRHARELFERIPAPRAAPLGCADAAWEKTSPYYVAAQAVLDPKDHEQFNELLALVQRVQSPLEIAPALKLIRGSGAGGEQRVILLQAIGAILETLAADDRSFMSALYDADAEVKRQTELREPWIRFLRRQFGAGSRCGEAADPKYHDFFYNLAAAYGLTEDEVTPEKTEASADVGTPTQNEDWVRLERALAAVRPETPEGLMEFRKLLNAVGDLKRAEGQTETDLFAAKAGLLQRMIWLAPEGEERQSAMARYVVLLRFSPARDEDWRAWLGSVDALTSTTRMTRPKELATLLAALESSGDAVLQLYVRLTRANISGVHRAGWDRGEPRRS